MFSVFWSICRKSVAKLIFVGSGHLKVQLGKLRQTYEYYRQYFQKWHIWLLQEHFLTVTAQRYVMIFTTHTYKTWYKNAKNVALSWISSNFHKLDLEITWNAFRLSYHVVSSYMYRYLFCFYPEIFGSIKIDVYMFTDQSFQRSIRAYSH